jgi:hypothetical protein
MCLREGQGKGMLVTDGWLRLYGVVVDVRARCRIVRLRTQKGKDVHRRSTQDRTPSILFEVSVSIT